MSENGGYTGHDNIHVGLQTHSLGEFYPLSVVGRINDEWQVWNTLTGEMLSERINIRQAHSFMEYLSERSITTTEAANSVYGNFIKLDDTITDIVESEEFEQLDTPTYETVLKEDLDTILSFVRDASEDLDSLNLEDINWLSDSISYFETTEEKDQYFGNLKDALDRIEGNYVNS